MVSPNKVETYRNAYEPLFGGRQESFDDMLDIRREAQEEYEQYRRQAWLEYETDFNQYKKLSDWERHILDKFQT